MDANVCEGVPTAMGSGYGEMPDGMGKMQRLAVVCEDAGTLDVVVQRVADGESLASVCKAWGIPHGGMLLWLMKDEKRMACYMNALSASAFREVDEAKDIADESGEAKLRVDVRWKRAKHHAPAVYGDKDIGGGGGITVIVQRQGTEPPTDITASGKTLVIGG